MRYTIFSILVSIILYLMVSFCKWNIFWILELGNYDVVDRLLIIFCLVIKEGVCFGLVWHLCEYKEYFLKFKN